MDLSKYKLHRTHGDGNFRLVDFKKIGNNVIFEKNVLVFHPENIEIGDNVYIGHNTILKGYYKNEMVIGDHTWIGQSCFFHSAGGIYIGKAVGIGPMVKIISSVHQEEDITKPIMFSGLKYNKVIIGDGSDIGVGSIILPGVSIGEGSQVGSGSVVTRDIEPFSVVAGVPAKLLRKRDSVMENENL